MMFTRTGKKKRSNLEHKAQVALIDYLAIAARPEILYRAVPNGEKRHISVAMRLKAEGVRRGTPDLFFCLPEGRVAWLEMKAPNGSLKKEQRAFRDGVLKLGHLWAHARNLDEAIPHLRAWGVLKERAPSSLFSTHHLESIKLNKEASNGTQA